MDNQIAEEIANELGDIASLNPDIQEEIQRLSRRWYISLRHVEITHEWLDEQRQSRLPGRVVGDSRTGKTMACQAYRSRNKPTNIAGKPPIIPVIFISATSDCGAKELFRLILEALNLKYQVARGTISEMRERAMRAMNACGVEMLIIDEAELIKPKIFSEARCIFDNLQISVILVGTRSLDNILMKDDRVSRRFRAGHYFEVLSGENFKQTVEIWEKQILKLPNPSNLFGSNKLRILYEATDGGFIGLLDMILRAAAIKVLKKGLTKIDLEILKEVAATYRV
jgi:DNA transposition AAA+ family ATPase